MPAQINRARICPSNP